MMFGSKPTHPTVYGMFRTVAPARRASTATPLARSVRLCLWLLVLLLPLRAFAATQMVVPVGPHGAAQAACHQMPSAAGVGDVAPDPVSHDHHTAEQPLSAEGTAAPTSEPGLTNGQPGGTCTYCLFCAPALTGGSPAQTGMLPAEAKLPPAQTAATPEGVRNALFRPPRG